MDKRRLCGRTAQLSLRQNREVCNAVKQQTCHAPPNPIRIADSETQYVEIQNPESQLMVGCRVWHSARGEGMLEKIDPENARNRPYQVRAVYAIARPFWLEE